MTTAFQATQLRIDCQVAPVIILGMHRSGTTMIAELLDRLGLFVGTKVQGDHEAVYFLDINEELFTQIHAFWDNPQSVVSFFNEPRAVEMTRLAAYARIFFVQCRGIPRLEAIS